jgi:STE24 endopeptidase
VISLVALFIGFYGWFDDVLRGVISNEILLSISFLVALGVISGIIDIPFSYYSTFKIEEDFGFNKSTKKTFWLDQLKEILISAVLTGVLYGAIVLIYDLIPEYFWILAWAVLIFFSLFMSMFYSQLIVPLFNKQTPLEEGELRTAIENFAKSVDFKVTDIYVMDSSKRSTKANAYFTGIGPKKRIVLFDTLIEKLTTEEIVAVLSHEIGHNKHKHIVKSICLSALTSLFMFAIFGYLVASPELSQAMGGSVPSFHLGMFAFMMLYSPISLILGILTSVLSRKNEYEADAFAAKHGLGDALCSALKKISSEALSNLQPHPAFVFLKYSHPTLLQRIRKIKTM